jgi:hypothetical protein
MPQGFKSYAATGGVVNPFVAIGFNVTPVATYHILGPGVGPAILVASPFVAADVP